MKYLSVCSGIEAATVAWHPLGWQPLAFSEIEPFPRKVLEHHYPDVPCYGDFTKLREMDFIKDADLLVGGTPCQAFSVAGLRQSLDDDRGNLTLEFVRLADAIDDLRPDRPCTIVWENVPGVLSVQDNAFGCFLAALVGNDAPLIPTGGKWTNAGLVVGPTRTAAWRVFDAQYFGVAQRRRRVFVVAGAGDGFDPAEVLFEREGMRRDTAPSRSKGENPSEIAGTIHASGGGTSRPGGQGNELDFCIPTEVAKTLTTGVGQRYDPETESLIVHGTQDPCVSDIAFAQGRNNGAENVLVQPIATHDVAFPINTQLGLRGAETSNTSREGIGIGNEGDPSFTLQAGHGHAVATSMAVRRLTPRECERLQGFPDDYTDIPKAADGPRYKALGNSMAVPVMAWIGKRIDEYVKAISTEGP